MDDTLLIYESQHIYRTSKLSSTARLLLDVLILGMRIDDNHVWYIEGAMDIFIEFYKSQLNRKITKKTIQNATSELVRAGLLLRTSKGQYRVERKLFLKIDVNQAKEKKLKGNDPHNGIQQLYSYSFGS